MKIVRDEYPRPQMVRPLWANLNGEWDFAFDFGKTGVPRNIHNATQLDRKIMVPFCPESELSGIGYKDFMPAVWYRRSITVTEEQLQGRVLLHFEAVEYKTRVWINGREIGRHTGGSTPFSFDITDAVTAGENNLAVYAEDDTRNPMQPRGKQSEIYESHGCDYTRVTGIWQTVWLEFVPKTYIVSYRVTPDVDKSKAYLKITTNNICKNATIRAAATYDGRQVGQQSVKLDSNNVNMELELSELHLWEPLDAKLYELELTLEAEDGSVDCVTGYFGMRSLKLVDKVVLINDKPVFQRLVLDQGYYPDGIYTAPSDEALKQDILLSIAAGFNGARMHQKVFERRYLYWADKLGYLVWGEYGSWGIDHTEAAALNYYLLPWMEAVERDYNSPALIGWCPFNETWNVGGRAQNNDVILAAYRVTKAMDDTRPVIDTSGHYHVETDIFDIHDYEQDVEKFAEHYEPMKTGGEVYVTYPDRQKYNGRPFFVSEYGGIKWDADGGIESWGYGNEPKTVEEFVTRYEGLAKALLDNPGVFALCYTQLYDVEQEKNGLYTYDRKPKFDEAVMKRLHDAMARPAAIEIEG